MRTSQIIQRHALQIPVLIRYTGLPVGRVRFTPGEVVSIASLGHVNSSDNALPH